MKTSIVLVLLLIPLSVFGQGWTFQSSGTTNALYAVFFVDTSEGWVAGAFGTILHTTDAGRTWIPQPSGTSLELRGIDFVDAENGWAVGADGTILRTTDGGLTWAMQRGAYDDLFAVSFVDGSTGWAAGSLGSVYRTVDGGRSWLRSGLSDWPNYGIHFADTVNGWVVGEDYDLGSGVIRHTTDGGLSWTRQRPAVTPSSNFREVYCVDVSTCWVAGSVGSIFHTTDAGTTWLPQTTGTTMWLRGINFPDGNNGWAVGYSGTILHTTNGGTTWENETVGTSITLNGVHFPETTTGWAVGSGGTILGYLAASPPVSVNAAVAPTSGDGTFEHTIDLTNNTDSSQTIDLWTVVTDPGGIRRSTPVIYGKTLLPGRSYSHSKSWELGANRPFGEYELTTYLGTYPDGIIDSSSTAYSRTSLGKETPAEERGIPDVFKLTGNYPNPFNPTTTISYELSSNADVKLTVLNVMGQEVATLVNRSEEAGYRSVTFDAKNLASGIYFYRLQAGAFVETKKLLLLK